MPHRSGPPFRFLKNIFLAGSCILVLSILPSSGQLHAQFYSLETNNLRLLYYDKDHATVIPHLRRCFENSFSFHRKLFHYQPAEKVTVFLQDFDDYGYAGATSLPFNYMILGIEPYEQVYETSPTNERMNWVMSHELMHVVTTDKASHADRIYRSLFFGKVSPTAQNPLSMAYSYLTTPRKYSPRWYLEGIAVFMETWMAGGIGRAQGGYDEMVFRTMVHDSSMFYDVVGLESEGTTIDFQIGQNSYLYGTRFVSYLADHYGTEKLLAWYDRTDDSDEDFASQFGKVYGTSLDDEWQRWIEWERRWQWSNLDTIDSQPVTSYRQISREPVGAVSRSYYDPGRQKLYAAVNYPGQLAHISAFDIHTGEVERLCDIPSPALYYVTALAYDSADGILFYTTHNNRGWRDLHSIDVATGETITLLKNCRIGDLAFDKADRSLWGVQHNNGVSTLVRIPHPWNGWNSIVQLPYGKDLFDIDLSPDGAVLTGSMLHISGRQTLIRMSVPKLLDGDSQYDSLCEFENNSPENFVFSRDGRYLYGTTYYTGVSNVVRYDTATQKVEWLTNTETGFFRPLPMTDDSLIVFRYSGKGFVPAVIAIRPREDVSAVNYLGWDVLQKNPVVKSWTLPSPMTVNIDSLTTSAGEYNGLAGLGLVSAYPVAEGYKDLAAYGVRFNFLDRMLLHDIDLTASYTPNRWLPSDERAHVAFNYRFWQWTLGATYNRANFYDLFGPTKTSRKGYSFSLGYENVLASDNPKTLQLNAGASAYGGLERLPDFQNVSVSYDRFYTANLSLSYRNLVRSLGGVEAEEGTRMQLGMLDNLVNGRNFPRWYGTADYGFLLPIPHSSIWLRTAGGYSIGSKDEPFANFYFGGFGNNWVDYQPSRRYREYAGFPGVELDAIGGTNFGKVMGEWVLPPIRFRRLGVMNLYCNWTQLTLFTTGIITNMESVDDRSMFMNAGGQMDIKLVIFSRLESTLSFGYAVAVAKDQRPTREFMASLKIL